MAFIVATTNYIYLHYAISYAGVTFMFGHERVALLISTVYSMYCARCYVGWLGLLFGLNVSFISSDILIHLLKNNINDSKSNDSSEQTKQTRSRAGHFFGESSHSSLGDDAFQSSSETPADRCPGVPSTSGTEAELSSEDEVARLLNCADHYSALGLTRYENVDASYLKKEYRKKVIVVLLLAFSFWVLVSGSVVLLPRYDLAIKPYYIFLLASNYITNLQTWL